MLVLVLFCRVAFTSSKLLNDEGFRGVTSLDNAGLDGEALSGGSGIRS